MQLLKVKNGIKSYSMCCSHFERYLKHPQGFELVYGGEVRGPLHILKEAPGQGREESIVSYVQERLSNVGVGEG